MTKRSSHFLKNVFYTVMANGISMILSAILTLFIPKLLSIESFGYWQLYLFYTSYIGFLHFGWLDGIYLRYGGKDYQDLDKDNFVTQFWMLCIIETIISLIMIVYSIVFNDDPIIRTIWISVSICSIITILRTYYLHIFQATDRIKEYARFTKIDKYIFFLLVLIFLFLDVKDYRIIILADLTGKIVALFLCVFSAPEITYMGQFKLSNGYLEAKKNIQAGSKLMLANIASLLIIGIIRLGIQKHWSVSAFAKVSLTMSISSLVMTFINSISIVLFPFLCKLKDNQITQTYNLIRCILIIPLFGFMILVFPLLKFLVVWLPKYKDSLAYIIILFPMCIYESKMALLINSFLKAFRKERWLLIINFTTVILSCILSYIVIVRIDSLILAVALIVFLQGFRCVISEILISKYLNQPIFSYIFFETLLTLVFMLAGWNLEPKWAVISYLFVYIIYLLAKRKDIGTAYKYILSLKK